MTVMNCIFFSCCDCFDVFFSGGSTFTIRGEGFNNVGNITVEKVVSKRYTRRNEDNKHYIYYKRKIKLISVLV